MRFNHKTTPPPRKARGGKLSKTFAMVLCLALLLTLFPTTAFAADFSPTDWTTLTNNLSSALPGESVHIRGDITLQGDIDLTSYAMGIQLIIEGGFSLTTGSYQITTMNMNQIAVGINGTLNINSGGKVINAASVGGMSGFNNEGTINIDNGGTIENNTGAGMTNTGTINNSGTITNNGKIDNSGTITGNTIAGNVPPNITTTSLPNGTVNIAYSQTLAADNSPTTWLLDSGSLPAGLNLSGATISGTPSGTGTSTFKIKATNTNGSHTKQFSITIIDVPSAPSNVNATAGDGQATISFTASANNGSPITSYTVTCVEDGSKTATGAASPITVTGLTNGTAYTFTVTATNSAGTGLASQPSNSVTPMPTVVAPTITGLPNSYTLYTDGRISWTPQPTGGTWSYDSDYLSMTKDGDKVTFKALKVGKTEVTYTVNGVSHTVSITINESTLPQTGDNGSVMLWLVLMLTSLCGVSALCLYRKKKEYADRV